MGVVFGGAVVEDCGLDGLNELGGFLAVFHRLGGEEVHDDLADVFLFVQGQRAKAGAVDGRLEEERPLSSHAFVALVAGYWYHGEVGDQVVEISRQEFLLDVSREDKVQFDPSVAFDDIALIIAGWRRKILIESPFLMSRIRRPCRRRLRPRPPRRLRCLIRRPQRRRRGDCTLRLDILRLEQLRQRFHLSLELRNAILLPLRGRDEAILPQSQAARARRLATGRAELALDLDRMTGVAGPRAFLLG